MCFNSVLIQLSSDNSCQHRIAWAESLTNASNSRIHGVYFQSELANITNQTPDMIMAPEGVAYVPEVAKNSKSIVKEDLQNIRRQLQKKQSKGNELHWFTVPGGIIEQLPVVSLTHDIVIVSRSWFNGFDQVQLHQLLPDFSEPLAAPVLVLPEHVPENAFFKKPLVIWDNTPQAARTLKSALPLLKKVGQTGILCDFHGSEEYDIVALEEVASWLQSHGIQVTSVNSAEDQKSLSASIESVVEENHHDLVIIGAKQDSMLRNLVYGKPMEQLLKRTTVPVLINN